MRRKRKILAEKANPFIKALAAIDERELQVVHAMTQPNFTLNDVIKWMFPEDTLRILKEAHGVVQEYYNKIVNISIAKTTFSIDVEATGIAVPVSEAISTQEHCHVEIMGYSEDVHNIHQQFNKVRDVVKWFGEHNVTTAAAVYYWPTILCLLPADHDVHNTNGVRYREVTGIGEIIPLLRETAGIIAGAALCPKPETTPSGKFSVTFHGSWPKTFAVL